MPLFDSDPWHWRLVARACAEFAYANRDTSCRGILVVADEGVLAFFDNGPPQDSMLLRDRIVDRFEGHLAGVGVRVLATTSYPQCGPDDGLTVAIVLDAAEGDEEEVAQAWRLACLDVQMYSSRDGG